MGITQPPRQSNYRIARDAGIRRLRERCEPRRLQHLGADVGAEGRIELPCLCWRFAVSLEPFSMTALPEGQELDLVWQILVLDYLSSECEHPQTRFQSFADFPDVRGYLPVFQGRVIQRLTWTVGRDKEQFAAAAERCGGVRGTDSPLSYLFHLFPRFEIQVLRDEGDEDFPTSFSLLLPDNATEMLSLEGMIVAAERLVASLQGKDPWGC